MQVKTAYATPVAVTEAEIARTVMTAAEEAACLVLTYVDGDGAVTARGVWPVILAARGAPVWISKAGDPCFAGHDSLYDRVVTFRLDRVIDAHVLSP